MKSNISIIFSVIIGTLLLVLLPLYSLMERQDNMAYNVVLNETIKFVDNIRNNGFIDNKAYGDYLLGIGSTSNKYKITIEAYKKKIIHDVNSDGTIKKDSFVEALELYNTQDILSELNSDLTKEEANVKNGVFLLDENDEIYVRVYNTNQTAGSMIYNLIAGTSGSKVIDISYGGIVKKVDWDLYTKVKEGSLEPPEVILSVPVNKAGNTNVVRTINEENKVEYSYVYDLSDEVNEDIIFSLRFNGADRIDINGTYVPVSTLENLTNEEQEYIKKKYIQLNGIVAEKVIIEVDKTNNNLLNIQLENIEQESLSEIVSIANVSILPGLGKDEYDIETVGAETVELELIRNEGENIEGQLITSLTGPFNWSELEQGKTSGYTALTKVFKNQEIFFLFETKGTAILEGEQKESVENSIVNLTGIFDYTIYTTQELENKLKVDISTEASNRTIIKVKYNQAATSQSLHLSNLELDVYSFELISSTLYDVLSDTEAPEFGDFIEYQLVGGSKESRVGKWYNGPVYVGMDYSNIIDYASIAKDKEGSGIYKYTVQIDYLEEQTIKSNEPIKIEPDNNRTEYTIIYRAYDNVGNVREVERKLKIDVTLPTETVFQYEGVKGQDNWYISNTVDIVILPGTDHQSGISKITYKILQGEVIYKQGEIANNTSAIVGIQTSGRFEVEVRIIDNAGNIQIDKTGELKIDSIAPSNPEITLIGQMNNDNTKYIDEVKVNIRTPQKTTVAGYAKTQYSILDVNTNTYISQGEHDSNINEITIGKEGIYEVRAIAYSNTGLTSSQTIKRFEISTPIPKEPIIVLSGTKANNDWYKSVVTVNISEATGDETIVKRLTYMIEKKQQDGTYILVKEGNNKDIVNIEVSGEYRVTAKAYNKNDDYVTTIKDVKIEIPEKPIIQVIGNELAEGIYGVPAKVKIKINNSYISGLKSVKVTLVGTVINQSKYLEIKNNEVEYLLDIPIAGTHTISVEITSEAGNTEGDVLVVLTQDL